MTTNCENAQQQTEKKQVKVMICIDDSEFAYNAFQYYKNFVHKPGNKVILMHISECAYVPSIHLMAENDSINPEELSEKMQQIKEKNDNLKKKFTTLCKDVAGIDYEVIIAHGDHGIGKTLVANIKSADIDLVVMGSRGQSTIRRTFFGSVSDYVVHHAHVPVAICPPPE